MARKLRVRRKKTQAEHKAEQIVVTDARIEGAQVSVNAHQAQLDGAQRQLAQAQETRAQLDTDDAGEFWTSFMAKHQKQKK